ncbi:MAG: hypothetical protein WBG41_03295 [Acidimicrobiales bacterium]
MFRLGRRFRSSYVEQCRRFLVEETEAFLSGRLVDLVEAAAPLPAWLEINWLVHAAPAELSEAGRSRWILVPSGSWAWARAVLLRELLAPTDGSLDAIAERQRRCLVPVELELICEDRRFASPSEVVDEAVGRLRQAARNDGRRPGSKAGRGGLGRPK